MLDKESFKFTKLTGPRAKSDLVRTGNVLNLEQTHSKWHNFYMVYFFPVILRFSPFSSSYLRSKLVWYWFQSLLSPEFYDKVRPIKVLKWNEPKTDFYFHNFLKIFDDISKLNSFFSIISVIFMTDLFQFSPKKLNFLILIVDFYSASCE